jgi:hypothetical protein
MRYHLRHFAPVRLAIVAAVLAPVLWIGFRNGGTEVGARLTVRAIGRYWTVLTPVVVVVLVPLLGTVWRLRTMQRAWLLAQPSRLTMVRDGLANFLAGCLPFAAVIAVLGGYLAAQVDRTTASLVTVGLVTVFGPLAGGYLTLAAGYLAGLWTASSGVRVAVVILLAVLDATSWLPFTVLSVSGTAAPVVRAGSWTTSNFRSDSGHVVGPGPGFLALRVIVCAVLTALIAASIWRQSRDAQGA